MKQRIAYEGSEFIIVVTNAFIKKQQKLPSKEKEKALKAWISYEKREKEGCYYEEKK